MPRIEFGDVGYEVDHYQATIHPNGWSLTIQASTPIAMDRGQKEWVSVPYSFGTTVQGEIEVMEVAGDIGSGFNYELFSLCNPVVAQRDQGNAKTSD